MRGSVTAKAACGSVALASWSGAAGPTGPSQGRGCGGFPYCVGILGSFILRPWGAGGAAPEIPCHLHRHGPEGVQRGWRKGWPRVARS